MVPGVTVCLGGTEYVVPPLTEDQLADFGVMIVGSKKIDETDLLFNMVLAALNRNYPHLTRADVEQLVDAGNHMELVKAIVADSPIMQRVQALN